MAKTVSVINQKGGVGKTTTAVNLSAAVGALGKRVLLADIDPQGNSTSGYGISKRNIENSTYDMLINGVKASEVVMKTKFRNVDLLPSDMNLAGAEVELVKGTYDDAHDRAVELQEQTGMTFIHPYDDELVIAGQGTIGLEILDQLPDVDAVIVPVGGGGLISGVAFAIKSLKPDVKVYGVQAEGAPSMYRSLHEHKYQTLSAVSTFADGIQVKTPGELTYKLCEEYVDDIVTVTEDETAAAILSLMENQKLVAEGAGAVPVAAALFHKLPIEGKKVVCLVSGGNIDVNILNRVITRGLVMSGRKANLTIALEDKPGQLSLVSDIVSACGANVVSVHHDRSDANMAITSCFLKLGLETRDAAQIETIKQKLTEAGFKLVTERA